MKRFLILITLITISASGFAQWQKTATNLLNGVSFGGAITFKAGRAWAGTTRLFTSNDTGSTWLPVNSLTVSGQIVSIDFFDANYGIVVTYGGGCYLTTNGGVSWTLALSQGSCLSGTFGATKDIIVVVGRASTRGHMYVSQNGGTSWTDNVVEVGGGTYHVATHKTGVICVLARNVSPARRSFIYSSVNNGTSWTKGNLAVELDCYGFTFGSCTEDAIYVINEAYNEPGDVQTEIFKADLMGNNSSQVYVNTDSYLTGSGSNSGEVIFVQTDANGILRSVDEGNTWTPIGGPGALWDSRCVHAVDQNVVIAIDDNGSLWKTVNCGGLLLPTNNNLSIIPPQTLVVNPCSTMTAKAIISTAVCRNITITNKILTGSYASTFAINGSSLPKTLSGANDTTIVVVTNKIDTGTFTAGLRIIGYYSDGSGNNIPFDTIIDLNALVTPAPPKITASMNTVNFPTRTPCGNQRDTIVRLTNTGCDTLKILSGPGIAPAGFKFDSLTYPIILAPGEQIDVHFYFDPLNPGNYAMYGVFLAESNKLQANIPITLLGAREPSKPTIYAKDSIVAFRSTTVCDALRDSLVVLTNTGCDTLRITSLPDDIGKEFSLDSLSLPIILAPGESTTLIVHFHPTVPGSYDTTIVVSLEGRGSTGKYTIVLSGTNTAVRPQITGSLSAVSFDTLSTCDGMRDTTLVLRNTGCDTLRIISGPGGLPPEYTIDGITLPIILPPDSSITITLHFKPSSAGRFVTTPIFTAERFGLTTNYTFFVEGIGEEGTGVLATTPPEFTFPIRSICSGADSLQGSITNTGCDTLVLDDASFTGDGVFTKTSIITPTRLAKGETIYYTIYFTPGTKGQHSGTMTITAHTAHGAMTSTTHTIPIKGDINDGTRTLAVKPTSIDFGTTTTCEERDSTVTLYNNGCDTLTITYITSLGSGFIINGTTPITIAPGDSISVLVSTSLDTAGQNPLSNGSFNVSSNADNTIASVTCSRGYIYPKQYSLSVASPSLGATTGDTISFVVSVDKPLENIKTVDMTFNYNTDLLEFIYAAGDNNVTLNGNKLHISGKPYITSVSGLLSTLYFRVYLSKDSTSTLELSSILLDGIDPAADPCATSATIGGSGTFTYIFQCGDHSIAGFMNGKMPLTINSLRPNPASGDIQLTLDARITTDYTIIIYDVLGKTVIKKNDHITQGEHTLLLETESLAAGVYYIKVSTPFGEDRVEFMKVK
jgi:photosystem II stability/assembly factor-like uncharacterized protein